MRPSWPVPPRLARPGPAWPSSTPAIHPSADYHRALPRCPSHWVQSHVPPPNLAYSVEFGALVRERERSERKTGARGPSRDGVRHCATHGGEKGWRG